MSKLSNAFITTIMAMAIAGESMVSDEKYSINEIIEKSDVTKEELLELLEKGIVRGQMIYGAPYIVGDTPYSIEKKLEEYKKRIIRNADYRRISNIVKEVEENK